MALSGVTSKTYTTKKAYWIWVEWSATQNITNNTSTVTANLYMGTNGYGYVNFTKTNKASVTIDGTRTYFNTVIVGKNTTKKLIGTASKVVDHNSAGAKTLAVSGWYHHDTSSTNFQLTIPSQNFTLNTIARASTPTVNYSSRPIGSTVRISTNAASSSFRHTIHYRLGNWSSNIATGVSSYFDWAPPKALALQMTNTTSRAGTITLYTYASSGGAHIGTKTLAFTTTVPNSGEYLPSVSTPTAAISGSRVDKTMGKYIQNYSKVDMAFNAYAGYGASVTGRTVRITGGPDNMPVHATSGTSGTLTGSGTYTITGYVTDSRGRTANSGSSRTITVHAYTAPRITNFTAIRNATTPTTVNTTRTGTYTTLGGSNVLTAITARRPTGGAWTDLNTSSEFGTYASTENSDTQSFDFRLTITDTLGQSAQSVITVSTGKVALSIREDIGIGAGKVHERGALDVGGDTYLGGNVYYNNEVLDYEKRLYSPTNGVIVDLYPSSFTQQMTTITITGNGYGGEPVHTILEFYHYNPAGTFYFFKQLNLGLAIPQAKVFLESGRVKVWFGTTRSYQTFKVSATRMAGVPITNLVLSSGSEPTGTNKVGANVITSYHSGNVITGTNSNGSYMKFPDGTMICYKYYGDVSLYSSARDEGGGVTGHFADFTWTFPQEFISRAYGNAMGRIYSGTQARVFHNIQADNNAHTDRLGVRFSGLNSFTLVSYYAVFAVGRWK